MVNKTNVSVSTAGIQPHHFSIPKLRTAFNGRVIAPGDPGYDQARTVFYGGIDRRPGGYHPGQGCERCCPCRIAGA